MPLSPMGSQLAAVHSANRRAFSSPIRGNSRLGSAWPRNFSPKAYRSVRQRAPICGAKRSSVPAGAFNADCLSLTCDTSTLLCYTWLTRERQSIGRERCKGSNGQRILLLGKRFAGSGWQRDTPCVALLGSPSSVPAPFTISNLAKPRCRWIPYAGLQRPYIWNWTLFSVIRQGAGPLCHTILKKRRARTKALCRHGFKSGWAYLGSVAGGGMGWPAGSARLGLGFLASRRHGAGPAAPMLTKLSF